MNPMPDVVLSMISDRLAVTLSDLIKLLSSSVKLQVKDPQEVRGVVDALAERNLVKARDLGKGGEVLYTITEDGVRELERTTRRGLTALLR